MYAHTVLAKTIALPKAKVSRLQARPKGLSDRPLETFGAVPLLLYFNAAQYHADVYTILILKDYKDAMRRSAEGDASPVASPPKAEVESGATMIAKPSARLRRGEILLQQIRI